MSDSTTATTTKKWFLWGGRGLSPYRKEVWLYEKNEGDPDRFDMAIFHRALESIPTALPGGRAQVADKSLQVEDTATGKVFSISMHPFSHIVSRVDEDKYIDSIEKYGVIAGDKAIIRKATEIATGAFGPVTPARAIVYSKDLIPSLVVLWYVVNVDVYDKKKLVPFSRTIGTDISKSVTDFTFLVNKWNSSSANTTSKVVDVWPYLSTSGSATVT